MLIRHPKARGEWAELRFMERALQLGFLVNKPWGDCAPYDVLTDYRGHFRRVQVKGTIYHCGNTYKCHLDSNGTPYTPDQIDVFASYVIPTNTWYIVPIEATNGQTHIWLTPTRKNSKYGMYVEAWHLLQQQVR